MLGIDVSKDTLVCTLLHPISQQKLWSDEVPNTPAGLKRLLKRVPADAAWALEPTGRYSQTVARAGRDAGRTVLLAQPKRTKAFLASIQSRAKTDRLDSQGIAMYALVHKLPLYPLKSPMIEQVDQLLSARKGLSRAIAGLHLQSRELPHAAPTLLKAINELKTQRSELDNQLKKLGKELVAHSDATPDSATPDSAASERASLATAIKTLREVPGIGPVVATTVASRLVARHFSRSDKFVAYCGLDVTVRQSGKRSGGSGLSKQGDAELRRLLFLAAQANLRAKDSPFKAQYQRELDKGLSTTAATCAVARKLARLCWALVTKGQTYNPARVYQQPQQKNS
jgi:transposase